MLHIRRRNNIIEYAFEPHTSQQYDNIHLMPRPSIHTNQKCVRMDKWYIANHVVIDGIIDTYITKFQEFVSTHPKYTVQMDEHQFRTQLLKKLYNASESRKKSFV